MGYTATFDSVRTADYLLHVFYTAVTVKISDMAENLKKYGGFIPGIRPGELLQNI